MTTREELLGCKLKAMTRQEVLDLIYSIRNRCEIILISSRFDIPHLDNFIHTLCEDNFLDAQIIVDGFCVEKD